MIDSKHKITPKEETDPELTFDTFYSVTKLLSEHSFHSFVETNDFKVWTEPREKFTSLISSLPAKSFKDAPRFYGIVIGMTLESMMLNRYPEAFNMFMRNEFKVVKDAFYKKMKRVGKIINGMDEKGVLYISENLVNIIRPDEMEKAKIAYQKEPVNMNMNDSIILARIIDFLYNGDMNNRYDIPEFSYNIDEVRNLAVELLERFGAPIDIEKQFICTDNNYKNIRKIKGVIDIEFDDFILEFKTGQNIENEKKEAMQCYLYSAILGKPVYLINLINGTMKNVKSSYTIERTKYLLDNYVKLDTFYHKTNIRRNKQNVRKTINENVYYIDTEFVMQRNPETFDIAIINGADIYKSIISTVNISKRNLHKAVDWLGLPKEIFLKSPDIIDISDKFTKLTQLYKGGVILNYYNCKNDIAFCSCEFEGRDISNIMTELMPNYGIFTTSNNKVSLSEAYNTLVNPLIMDECITLHNASDDALLLWAIDYIGKI